MALFADRRIVRILEFRRDADPPVIIMEHVDGFKLGRIGPSLEFAQRARVLIEICGALDTPRARPAAPRSQAVEHHGRRPARAADPRLRPQFRSSLSRPPERYAALRRPGTARPVAADRPAHGCLRTRGRAVRAPLRSGAVRRHARRRGDCRDREGQPRLPVEIDPRVPEPLQAIALKAMERDPRQRYASALDLGVDLQRYLDRRPVQARPSVYSSTLGMRVAPHVQQVGEWLRLRLIYPHEAERLRSAYRALDAREDDWIVDTGAVLFADCPLPRRVLLVCGSLFYFAAHRWYDAVAGVVRPLLVLGLPFAGLNAAAHHLYRRDHKAVAVAFLLAAVSLLPLLLIILFHETGFFVVAPDTPGQLLQDGSISNRQLQITTLAACLWCFVLALQTRTAALSTVCVGLVFLCGLAVLSDFGLRSWLVDGRWDLLAVHAFPLVILYAGLGIYAEREHRPWFARPAYVAAAVLIIAVMELLALNGRTFHCLGVSLQSMQSADVSDRRLIATLAAMALNGVGFYALASAFDRHGTELQATATRLLFTLSPFAILQPLGYLVRTAEYSPRYDWIYLGLALVIALVSQKRQRRAFYYAGVLNTGAALYLIADHRGWFDRPLWALAVIVSGLLALGVGFVLDRRERAQRGVRV